MKVVECYTGFIMKHCDELSDSEKIVRRTKLCMGGQTSPKGKARQFSATEIEKMTAYYRQANQLTTVSMSGEKIDALLRRTLFQNESTLDDRTM